MTCLQTSIFNIETEGLVWSTRIKSNRTTSTTILQKRKKTLCLFLSTWILFSVFSTVSLGAKTVIVVRIKGMYLHWKNNLFLNYLLWSTCFESFHRPIDNNRLLQGDPEFMEPLFFWVGGSKRIIWWDKTNYRNLVCMSLF